MKRCRPVIISCLLFILLAPGNAYGRISLQEREALEALYEKWGSVRANDQKISKPSYFCIPCET